MLQWEEERLCMGREHRCSYSVAINGGGNREGYKGRLMWYSLKYNRMELLPLGMDGMLGS